jgi:hypothetical protein
MGAAACSVAAVSLFSIQNHLYVKFCQELYHFQYTKYNRFLFKNQYFFDFKNYGKHMRRHKGISVQACEEPHKNSRQ